MDHLNLLMTTTAMMNTTMLYVIMMVEHVVTTKMMVGIPFVQNVNVLVSSISTPSREKFSFFSV